MTSTLFTRFWSHKTLSIFKSVKTYHYIHELPGNTQNFEEYLNNCFLLSGDSLLTYPCCGLRNMTRKWQSGHPNGNNFNLQASLCICCCLMKTIKRVMYTGGNTIAERVFFQSVIQISSFSLIFRATRDAPYCSGLNKIFFLASLFFSKKVNTWYSMHTSHLS